jgi:glycosyltransferase involved in cell wall biosynthesis
LELRKIYRQYKVDVALHYTIKPVIYGSLAARLSGTQNISTLTGLGYAFITPGLVNRVVKGLYRRALRSAKHTFFQNADDRALFLKNRLVDTGRSGIIAGSGINTDRFAPYPDENEDQLNFLFIGRLLYDKGIIEFFEAARIIRQTYPRAVFNILGGLDDGNPSGVSAIELQEWQQSGHIVYHGQVTDTRPYIAKATAVVLPSYREGLPRVMLEGMSMGKPLITSDVPGCRDTVQDGYNGYLVKVRDAGSLARGIEKMIKLTPAERREMGRRGRELALNRFAEPVIVEEYVRMLNAIKKERY